MALFQSRCRLRAVAGICAAAATASVLAACGSDSGPPTLTWYINPDNGGQATLAEKCARRLGRRLHGRHPGAAERRHRSSASSSSAGSRPRTPPST